MASQPELQAIHCHEIDYDRIHIADIDDSRLADRWPDGNGHRMVQ